MRDGSTNRHGIPVFPPYERPQCAWALCTRSPHHELFEIRLCIEHIRHVHDLYESWTKEADPYRNVPSSLMRYVVRESQPQPELAKPEPQWH